MTENTVVYTIATHTHCWHTEATGMAYDEVSVWEQTCCHCGARRTMQSYREVVPGHGPYAAPLTERRTRELPPGVQPWERP